MNLAVFGQEYAGQYDLLYADKDYEKECDLIEQVFQQYAEGPVKTILDLGCGTGNHAVPLARRGYQVSGVDRSAEMLARAQKKVMTELPDLSHRPVLVEGDVRNVDLGKTFDAVLMMFAVLGYQLTNDDVLAALGTVGRHLNPGGIFICDVWYGPAVLAIRPGERTKVISAADGKIIRTASGRLDTYNHLCEVRYHLRHMRDNQVISETEESHQMRYFFPQELAVLMQHANLKMTDIRDFGNLKQQPSEETWNVLAIAKFDG